MRQSWIWLLGGALFALVGAGVWDYGAHALLLAAFVAPLMLLGMLEPLGTVPCSTSIYAWSRPR